MIRWEYTTVTVEGGDLTTSLEWIDEAGKDGWEVIHVQATPFGMVFLTKRPLPSADVQGSPELVKHSHSTRFMCNSSCPYHGTAHEIEG